MREIRLKVDDAAYEALENLRVKSGAKDFNELFRNAFKIFAWIANEFEAGRKPISMSPEEG